MGGSHIQGLSELCVVRSNPEFGLRGQCPLGIASVLLNILTCALLYKQFRGPLAVGTAPLLWQG